MGPEGGKGGGQIVAAGTPEQVVIAARLHFSRRDRFSGRKETHLPHRHRPSPLPRHQASRQKRHQEIAQTPRRKTSHPHRAAMEPRQHNLRDVSVKIPRDELTVCCGPSGSGKSSLAMDTIYAEGQRRYVESLSSYARQFVGQLQKPAGRIDRGALAGDCHRADAPPDTRLARRSAPSPKSTTTFAY